MLLIMAWLLAGCQYNQSNDLYSQAMLVASAIQLGHIASSLRKTIAAPALH